MSNGTLKDNEFGRRLLANVIDETAQKEPHRECFSFPRSSDPKDGWRVITFKEYANAINHISHIIVEKCGHPPAGTIPTLAYIGPNDARYVVLLIAAIKAGYAAFFISPRNPSEAQIELFNKTDCRYICFADSYRSTVKPWIQERPMEAIEVPPVDDWFPSHEVEHFPYTKTFDEAEWDPLAVLHTSGSTGMPKPVVIKQGMVAINDAYHNLPDWKGHKTFIRAWCEDSKRTWHPFPLFHAGGLYLFLMRVIYWGHPIALGLTDRPLSSDTVMECLENLDVEGVLLAPSILEEMSQSADCIEVLSKLKSVAFGGSHLSKEAGNRLAAAGVRFLNSISSTEATPYPIYAQSNPELWQYFVINSDLFGVEWRKAEAEDDLYRLVFVRQSKHPGFQSCFYTFPDKQEFDSGDLYKPHPTIPDNWICMGRSDNIIVFSNGEKLNPVSIEAEIEQHPLVKGALVIGAGRFQAALLVEPHEYPQGDKEAQHFIESIWPSVERANSETVAHGQIDRQFILLTSPEKPLPRGGKGIIQRGNSLKLYQNEITQLYENGGFMSNADIDPFNTGSEEALMESIKQALQSRLGAKGKAIDLETDFFSAGIDSLQVINATRVLRAGLEAAGHHVDVTTRIIYNNPTIRRLASFFYSVVRGEVQLTPDGNEQDLHTMEALWKKYTECLPAAKEGRQDPLDENQTVLLTGSTGSLGSYLLDLLIKSPAVKTVVCLNRSKDSAIRQAQAMKKRGLSDAGDQSKCIFLHADMAQPDFGLGTETYNQLLADADRFIHNAWPVNFNLTLESFEPHLQGVRNIANFAAEASKRVAVIFVSSIGTANRWNSARDGPVPEQRLEDMRLASYGYGKSKMVASLILEDAAKPGDFPLAIIRVGQIAGPEADAGSWNKQDQFPATFASSLYLKALPSSLAHLTRVDWTPVEKIAGLVVEVGGISIKVPAEDINGYFHGVNPTAVSWIEVALAAQEYYGKDRIPELVSLEEWVDKLEESGTQEAGDKNPGVKLLHQFRELATDPQPPVIYDMQRTLERSPSMRAVTAITPQLMSHWCKQWGFEK
ncbi:acetyl-CoA synthetase-like protein [Hypoxylon sp. NC1633]|nr:acetyl-CoA synthetase-like protein [Hypoxylon sp. NC1633]